jgi:hypothetical protein
VAEAGYAGDDGADGGAAAGIRANPRAVLLGLVRGKLPV